MLETIQHFVDSCKSNGLVIIDRPTGDGKTYDTMRYIHDNFQKDGEHKFFYITPEKKNLNQAFEDLKGMCQGEDETQDFVSSALLIPSNLDCVVNHLNDAYPKMSESFKNQKAVKTLKKAVDGLKATPKGQPLLYQEEEKAIREIYEPAFREEIIALLSKDKAYSDQNTVGRIRFIREKYPFLIEIYPSICSKEKTIFFMTTDKFFYGNSTLVERGYRFVTSSLVKNAIVFIDEIDSTKLSILDKQITDSLQRSVDIFKLFRQIYHSLESGHFPPRLLNEIKDSCNQLSSSDVLEKMRKSFETDCKKKELDKLIKYQPTEEGKSLLFQDYDIFTFNSAKGEKKKDLIVQDDEDKKMHLVSLQDTKEEGKENKQFDSTIRSVRGLITYFCVGVGMISDRYMEWYNKEGRKPQADCIQIDSAISSVLHGFDLDNSFYPLLTRLISNNQNFFQSKKRKFITSDFYEEGFRYYSFFDRIDQNETTTVQMIELLESPESFLLNLCSNALVVGLSATGTIDAVTCNYDLGYLRQNLGNKFYEIPIDDKKRMHEAFSNNHKNNNAPIHPFIVSGSPKMGSTGSQTEVLLSFLTENKEVAGAISQKISSLCTAQYEQVRFLKVMVAIKNFLIQEDSKVLLVLTNKNVKTDKDSLFSVETIQGILVLLKEEQQNISGYEQIPLFGQEFDENKGKIREFVLAGKKVILLSSYASVGTGQNLNYELLDKNRDVVNRDIDSIYVELPTNNLVNLSTGIDESGLMKYIYQVEALAQVGDISQKEVRAYVSHGFKCFIGTNEQDCSFTKLYQTKSVNNQIVKVLEQAIGRISRTREKTDSVHIYIDDCILKVNFSCEHGRWLNREYKAFIDKIEESNQAVELPPEAQTVNNINNKNCRITAGKIAKMLSDNSEAWSSADMKQWKDLRNFILVHPTISEKALFESDYRYLCLYVKAKPGNQINHCFYSKDLKSVSWDKDDNHPYEVSFEASRLPKLLLNQKVRPIFTDNGFALNFSPSDYVLNPVAFHNLYLGAIGEEVGKVLLASTGISLCEIQEGKAFEKFDFVYTNDKDVYFDFKFWNDHFPHSSADDEMSHDKEVIKIEKKMESIGAKKAFIVNILGPSNIDPKPTGTNQNIFLIPALIDENERHGIKKNLKFILDYIHA